MRDEDLKNLPQTISREKLFDALALLGFGPEQWKDISHIDIGPQSVAITAYWVDENGRRTSRPFSDTQLAVPEFTVTIPLLGEMERPAASSRVVGQQLCGVEHEFDFVRCSKAAGHEDRHGGIGEDGGAYVW